MSPYFALDADPASLQLTVHATGDEANGVVLDILERVIAENGERDRRFRIMAARSHDA